MEESCCAVCAENLEWVAYGFCGHREVCSTCVVRLRFILADRRCCICKTQCPFVFVTKEFGDYTKTITDFSTFPSDPKEGCVGGSLWYHEETKVFFDDFNQYTKIKSMCRLSCTSCDKSKKGSKSNHRLRFKSVEHLKDHLSHQHKLHMCSLCLVGRKVFVCEQKLFTKDQLNQHISSGDSEVDGSESERGGFTGHPMCEFCKRPFYGGNELYTHMSREHYTCHICQRLRPGQYEYYGNYDDLEAHFRSDHFLCEDESCLAKKFIVFEIEADLKRHNAVDHKDRVSGSQQSALQIQSGFQVQSRRGRRRSSQASYSINGDYPLLQPMSSSGGSRLGEASFPPLPVQANRRQTRFGQNSESSNTMTTLRRNQTNRSVTAISSRAWPALSRGPTQASVPSSIQSSSASAQSQSRTLASAVPQGARNEHTTVGGCTSGSSLNHHTSSTAKMSDTRSLEQPSHSGSPPVSAVKSLRSSSSTNAKVSNIGGSDVQSDNKSLVDKIRAILGEDEELFSAFKDASGKYRHGSIDARTYLEFVRGYGLSHLVLDMARLCPDPKRQKELIDAHNACLRRGNDSSQGKESCGLKKNKGKAVKVESSSDSMGFKVQQYSGSKCQDEDKEKIQKDNKGKTVVDSSSGGGVGFKKTPKFLRARLGEKSMAAIVNHRDSSNTTTEAELAESKNDDNSRSSQSSSGGLQLRGAWRRGSAKLFS